MASYEKRRNGKWSVRFYILNDDGKKFVKRLSGFKKKCDAEKAYRDFAQKNATISPIISLKQNIEQPKMTFGNLYHEYYKWQISRVKESSLFDYRSVFGRHILPIFESIVVDAIEPIEILKWQQSINDKNLSFAYKEKSMRYFSSVFNFGIKYYGIKFNPLSNVDKFKRTEVKKEMTIWSETEFMKFIAAVDDIIYKSFFATLYLSGARVGELLALTWSDFDNGKIKISKSVTRKSFDLSKDKPYNISSPKNLSSYRDIILPQNCVTLINKLKETTDGDFIFNGQRPLAETSYQRKFKEYCKFADVKKIRIHDLRHSHVSLLISKGENIVLIAKRLGHSNIEQTLNTYSHLMPDAEQDLVTKLDMHF